MSKVVSIIIPVYNVEKYLSKCLETVVLQSYTDLEVILIDDGSTDNSGYLCDVYAQKYPFVKAVHQKNSGPGIARNTGLDLITGDYYTFIDSDDYVSYEYIKTMVNIMEKNNVDVVEVGSIGLRERYNLLDSDENMRDYIITKNDGLVQDYFSEQRKLRYVIWGRLYRTERFKDIRFSEGSIAEDSEYSLQISTRAEAIYKHNKCLYVYRAYHESLMRTKFNKKFFYTLKVAYRDMKICDELELEDVSWEYIINRFYKECICLLSRTAATKMEKIFANEIEEMFTINNSVMELADKHFVNVKYNLDELIKLYIDNASKYRARHLLSIIRDKLKQFILSIFCKYKVLINYEYRF